MNLLSATREGGVRYFEEELASVVLIRILRLERKCVG
jgi:hypothetical protein